MNYNYNLSPSLNHPIIYYDDYGRTYSISPDNNTFIYYLEDGTAYSYDEYNEIFYYSPRGERYYLDENNNTFFYSPDNTKIYFNFDEMGNIIVSNPRPNSIANTWNKNKNFTSKKKKKFTQLSNSPSVHGTEIKQRIPLEKKNIDHLTNEKLFSLFNITNPDYNEISATTEMPFLSDHTIAWYKIKITKKTEISITSWNMLNQGKTYYFNDIEDYNNPWKIIESNEEYKTRVHKQILKILEIIDETDISIFFLQEANYFYNNRDEITEKFREELRKKNWSLTLVPDNTNLFNVTLFNQLRFKVIRKAKNFYPLGPKFTTIQQLYLTDTLSNKKIALGNVHFPPQYSRKKIYDYITNIDNTEVPSLAGKILRIFGGDTNKQAKNLFFGNKAYPTLLSSHTKKRTENFFFVIPEKWKITVTEMPICYFNKQSTLSLSLESSSIIDSTYLKKETPSGDIPISFTNLDDIKYKNTTELKNLLYKVSQLIDLKFKPHGKLFIKYQEPQKFEFLVYGEEKRNNFENIIQDLKPTFESTGSTINHEQCYSLLFKSKVSLEDLNSKMLNVFSKLIDPSYFSFFFNTDNYFYRPFIKDLFEPFIPYSKKEIRRRKIQSLLISNTEDQISVTEFKKKLINH